MDEDGIPAVPNLLSASQVAERIGLTHRSVSRLVHTKEIPVVGTFGVQHQLVFREEDVDAYVEEHPKTS